MELRCFHVEVRGVVDPQRCVRWQPGSDALTGGLAFHRVADRLGIDPMAIDIEVQDHLRPEAFTDRDLAADRVGPVGR